ncbi:MAG: 4-hydroxy-tetrahydrodipicolinate reductase [Bradymonadaceae bacterium]
MTSPVRIAIVGAAGRMGLSLLENANGLDDVEAVAAIVDPRSGDVGRKLGPRGLVAEPSLMERIEGVDVVIDFSAPASCLESAQIAARAGKAFLSGTTGLSPDQQSVLNAHGSHIPVLHAANFSVGVNVLNKMVEIASQATGPDFDIEIFEAHHRNKVDAPSGTALFLGEAAARGRDRALGDVARWERHGQTGERSASEIGFQVLRGGDVVGEHTVFFCAPGERIELTHRATDRGIFARGALRAARWLAPRKPGIYTMEDVLFSPTSPS